MMIQSLSDMKMFMAVFFICMLAFTDAFMSIEKIKSLSTIDDVDDVDDVAIIPDHTHERFLKSGGGSSSSSNADTKKVNETIY